MVGTRNTDDTRYRSTSRSHSPASNRACTTVVRPPRATVAGRVVAFGPNGCLLEVTGSPDEIDALLARLDELGVVTASVRSGEVAAPQIGNPTPLPGRDS